MKALSELLNPRFLPIHKITVAFYHPEGLSLYVPGRYPLARWAVKALCCSFSVGKTIEGQAIGLPPGLNPAGIHKGCQGKTKKIVRCVPYFLLPFAAQNFPVPEC